MRPPNGIGTMAVVTNRERYSVPEFNTMYCHARPRGADSIYQVPNPRLKAKRQRERARTHPRAQPMLYYRAPGNKMVFAEYNGPVQTSSRVDTYMEQFLGHALFMSTAKYQTGRYKRVGGGFKPGSAYFRHLVETMERQKVEKIKRTSRMEAIKETNVKPMRVFIRTSSSDTNSSDPDKLDEKIVFLSVNDYCHVQDDDMDIKDILKPYLTNSELSNFSKIEKEEIKPVRSFIRTKSGKMIERIIYIPSTVYSGLINGTMDAKSAISPHTKLSDGESLDGWGAAQLKTIKVRLRTRTGEIIERTVLMSFTDYKLVLEGDATAEDILRLYISIDIGTVVEDFKKCPSPTLRELTVTVGTTGEGIHDKSIILTDYELNGLYEQGNYNEESFRKLFKLRPEQVIVDYDEPDTVYNTSDDEIEEAIEKRKEETGDPVPVISRVGKDGYVYDYFKDPVTGKLFKKRGKRRIVVGGSDVTTDVDSGISSLNTSYMSESPHRHIIDHHKKIDLDKILEEERTNILKAKAARQDQKKNRILRRKDSKRELTNHIKQEVQRKHERKLKHPRSETKTFRLPRINHHDEDSTIPKDRISTNLNVKQYIEGCTDNDASKDEFLLQSMTDMSRTNIESSTNPTVDSNSRSLDNNSTHTDELEMHNAGKDSVNNSSESDSNKVEHQDVSLHKVNDKMATEVTKGSKQSVFNNIKLPTISRNKYNTKRKMKLIIDSPEPTKFPSIDSNSKDDNASEVKDNSTDETVAKETVTLPPIDDDEKYSVTMLPIRKPKPISNLASTKFKRINRTRLTEVVTSDENIRRKLSPPISIPFENHKRNLNIGPLNYKANAKNYNEANETYSLEDKKYVSNNTEIEEDRIELDDIKTNSIIESENEPDIDSEYTESNPATIYEVSPDETDFDSLEYSSYSEFSEGGTKYKGRRRKKRPWQGPMNLRTSEREREAKERKAARIKELRDRRERRLTQQERVDIAQSKRDQRRAEGEAASKMLQEPLLGDNQNVHLDDETIDESDRVDRSVETKTKKKRKTKKYRSSGQTGDGHKANKIRKEKPKVKTSSEVNETKTQTELKVDGKGATTAREGNKLKTKQKQPQITPRKTHRAGESNNPKKQKKDSKEMKVAKYIADGNEADNEEDGESVLERSKKRRKKLIDIEFVAPISRPRPESPPDSLNSSFELYWTSDDENKEDYFEETNGIFKLKENVHRIDLTKVKKKDLQRLGLDVTQRKQQITRVIKKMFDETGDNIRVEHKGEKVGFKPITEYTSDVDTEELAEDSDLDVDTVAGRRRVNILMRRGGEKMASHMKDIIKQSNLKEPRAAKKEETDTGVDFLSHYQLVDKMKVNGYARAFVVEDESYRGKIPFKLARNALGGVYGMQDVTYKQVDYTFKVLDIGEQSKLTFRMFSVITALLERITSMDSYCKQLLQVCNLADIERKIQLYRDMFYTNLKSFGDPNHITTESLEIELMAGGLNKHQQIYLMDKLRGKPPKVKYEISFLDYIAYIPLFLSMHENICDNPLDMRDTKYEDNNDKADTLQRDMNPLNCPLKTDSSYMMRLKAKLILEGKLRVEVSPQQISLYKKYYNMPEMIGATTV
ncbi:unnamed protein product [Owenia fusiformis]|uniref:Uncharacterized protein n=1 Tax=Owenia fusiformis TaxID=6347 RepID=A0A8S4Q4N3_OWEFU|nr:unnamed protein product [Owenia fusiformis]